MGGFLGLGHSSAKTDRGNQLAGINAAWSVYNRGLPMSDTSAAEGKTTTGMGITGLEQAKKYWQDILSGNPTSTAMAAAPVTNAVTAEADAARREAAEKGTARGGGTNAAMQGAETDRMTAVNNAIAAQAPEAAKGVQSIATAETTVGRDQLTRALQSLGLSADVADEIINSSIQSRPVSMQANAAVRQQWSNALAALGL